MSCSRKRIADKSIAFRIKVFFGAGSLYPEQGKVMMRKTEGQIGNSG
jgi:hypothetical protein